MFNYHPSWLIRLAKMNFRDKTILYNIRAVDQCAQGGWVPFAANSMELRDRNKETKDLRGGCGGRTMDRSAGAAKWGAILVPCKYNNNNIITVGLVPGARRKRNFNIRFTRNTQATLLLFTRKTFYWRPPPRPRM